MGRAKSSRKGKKEWRANISTQDVDEFVEKAALEARSGGALDAVPSDALFFVDHAKDTTIARKVNKHRAKVLQADSILQRNPLIYVLPEPGKSTKKRKDRDVAKPQTKSRALASPTVPIREEKRSESVFDIWGDEVKENGAGGDEKCARKKRAGQQMRIEAPAVEVDAPGCSYNPTFDDHQDVLGVAVAEEMLKVYNKELQPAPILPVVPGTVLDPEDVFFLEADNGDVGDEEDAADGADTLNSASKAVKAKKLTRADLNRRARRRGVLKAEAKRLQLVKVGKDIQRIPELMDDIDTENKEKERVRIRRIVSREEKRAQGPPRLGRYKFKPEPVQVLLTEEVTGSLRKLKGYPMLARERFKSLQRRGILEPRQPSKRKEKRKRVEYVQGTKGQKEREMHAATLAEREAKKHTLSAIPLQ